MKIEGLSLIYKITNPFDEVYIGQTINGKDRFNAYLKLRCKNQKLLYKSLVRYGITNHKIEIITYCDKKDANKTEIFYINFYNSFYKNNIKGLNLTIGGQGDRPKGKIKLSKEIKEKLGTYTSKVVLQYDLDGNFIQEWKSCSDAARNLNCNIAAICFCAKGKIKTSNGFMWRYKKEDIIPTKIEKVLPDIVNGWKFKFKNRQLTNNKQIIQYSLNGDFIREFVGLREAGRVLGIKSYIKIGYCAKGNPKYKQAFGFQWRFKTNDYPLEIDSVTSRKYKNT